MATERFANNAQTTLAAPGINSGQTSFDVADASVLPTLSGADQFRIRIDNEEMIVTGVSGNTLTGVTRGAEGTANVLHNTGATVTHNLTAGALDNIIASISAVPAWNGLNFLTAPPSSGWTWDNQGASVITTQNSDQSQSYQYLHAVQASAAQARLRYRTAPGSTPYTITYYMEWDYFGSGANQGPMVGFRDSAGKYVLFYAPVDAGSAKIVTAKWSAATTPVAAYSTTTSNVVIAGRGWFQITDDGTNLIFRTSVDGKNWRQFDSRARGDYLATAPNAITWGAYANDSDVEVALLSYVES